ncbi:MULTISPECIES: WecB/TagA/CpsF family glycosyltransferase [Pontibacillus]|uniref:N-acetylglucosaminyldiphosphoundecaprenol N-acetyl-beta-D-mannosaminyltransferase n=1 Tax=Pontibacillus chungwhensis TaxID=265426 RepID=A0ABY8UXB3_9BACI|nr:MULTISPECIES: WecB/TagA/CpsF family glycosyltransferase [Pontibacillus]MCD5324100.1 WecB/TagA/CpsF family glycosyltransferase [Pontibacillus sp. HN14]WIF97843.1 WecB/TagA/CpsF family glycosyltransferase [Pontibacillus chungwhensis]
MKNEQYMGVEVSPLSYEEITQQLKTRVQRLEQSTIIAVNPEKIMKAQEDATLRDLINGSTFQIPDGVGVLLASRLSGGQVRSRVTGVDMMDHLLKLSAKEGYSVFFYGAKEEVVTKAIDNIQEKYPALKVAGHANGYVQDQEALIQQIQESKADVMFIALGSPKQELWIRENKDRLPVKVFQGVGGSFDVYAGHVKRAPAPFRKVGMEWFYRLATDPKRFKRQLALPKFLWKIVTKK